MHQSICENGHYYDSSKFPSCPHCTNALAGIPDDRLLGMNQTLVSSAIPDRERLDKYRSQVERATVGWLTCIEGNMFGESFVLREGDNHIGRARNMDVSLCYESSVSRKNHAILSYDSEKNRYTLHTMDSENLVFCNSRRVKKVKTLKSRDILILGHCALIFVPLCDNSFQWNMINYEENKYKKD